MEAPTERVNNLRHRRPFLAKTHSFILRERTEGVRIAYVSHGHSLRTLRSFSLTDVCQHVGFVERRMNIRNHNHALTSLGLFGDAFLSSFHATNGTVPLLLRFFVAGERFCYVRCRRYLAVVERPTRNFSLSTLFFVVADTATLGMDANVSATINAMVLLRHRRNALAFVVAELTTLN